MLFQPVEVGLLAADFTKIQPSRPIHGASLACVAQRSTHMPTKRFGDEYPAKSGIIITPKLNPSGKRAWRVDIPATRTGDRREQRQFTSKDAACAYATHRLAEIRRVGHHAFLLTASQRQEAAAAFALLAPYAVSLPDAIRLAIRHLLPGKGRIPLAELRERFLAAPGRRRGRLLARRARSLETVRLRTARFVQFAGGCMADEVNPERVKEWMASLTGLSALTRNSYRLAVHAMFTFGMTEGYCVENPVSKVPMFEVEQRTPGILTVEEATSLLHAAEATEPTLGLLGFVTLGLLAGLRRTEILRLDWSAVKWERKMVTVDGTIAKSGSIRNVTLSDNALEWLKLCRARSGKFAPANLNVRFRHLRRHAGIEHWQGNALRHSFASYLYDFSQDAALTSAQLGHSSGTRLLFAHYRSLVPLGDGKRFFSIMPRTPTTVTETCLQACATPAVA